MPDFSKLRAADMRFMLRAAAGWAIGALIFLPAAALAVSKTEVSASSIGYISSGLSFICAFCAGRAAVRGADRALIYKALISAAELCILLLSIGFMAGKGNIRASAVLSLVSFTFSGCLLAAVLSTGKRGERRKRKFISKK